MSTNQEKIIKIIQEISTEENDFHINDNLIEDGVLDSFDLLEIVVALQEEFSIKIKGKDIKINTFNSVKSIEDIVESYL